MMENYSISQVFSVAVAVVLLFTFYILLAANLVTNQGLLTPLLLIIIAVIALAIMMEVSKIESQLKGGKVRRLK